ncbi:MAG: IS3 family transposase [Spirochaetes bacterium]|nr:IS3 family transposase [Spirochaetota bacterium]
MHVDHKKVERIMRENGLRSKRSKSSKSGWIVI